MESEADADDDGSGADASTRSDAAQPIGLLAALLQTMPAVPAPDERIAFAAGEAGQNAGPPSSIAPVNATPTPTPTAAGSGISTAAADIALPKNGAAGAPVTADPLPAAEPQARSPRPVAADAVLPDALLAMINGAPAPAAAAAGRLSAPSPAPSATPPPTPGDFAEPLAERIVWMSDSARANGGAGLQQARISLHPAELGSLQIRVELRADGSTAVCFDVDTPEARRAIEASLPQLRELLAPAAAGSDAPPPRFELSGGATQQQQSPSPQRQATARASATGVTDDAVDAVQSGNLPAQRHRVGLIDQFA